MYGAVSRLQFCQIVNVITLFLVNMICTFLYPMWYIFCWIHIFQQSWKSGCYFFKYCLFSILVKLSFWGFGQTNFWSFCFVFCVSCVCCAKLLQSHLTVCDPLDCSPPGSSVPGILQAEFYRFCPCRFCRILGWVAMLSSKGSSNPGIESVSLIPPDLGGRFFTITTVWETISLSLFLIFFFFCCFLCDFFHNVFQFTNFAFSCV